MDAGADAAEMVQAAEALCKLQRLLHGESAAAEAHRARGAKMQTTHSRLAKLTVEVRETRQRVAAGRLARPEMAAAGGSRPIGYDDESRYRRMLGGLQTQPVLLARAVVSTVEAAALVSGSPGGQHSESLFWLGASSEPAGQDGAVASNFTPGDAASAFDWAAFAEFAIDELFGCTGSNATVGSNTVSAANTRASPPFCRPLFASRGGFASNSPFRTTSGQACSWTSCTCEPSRPTSPPEPVRSAAAPAQWWRTFGERMRGGHSRRRDCHFTDTPPPPILKPLLKDEGGAAE